MDKEFLQPCGCVVVKRWRGNRPPLWYISGQEEGISENPLHAPFLYSEAANDSIARLVLREFCPHQKSAQQARRADATSAASSQVSPGTLEQN